VSSASYMYVCITMTPVRHKALLHTRSFLLENWTK